VLALAGTKHGERVLFAVAVMESSIFPVPPDAVLLCMGVAKPKKSLWYASLATVGSVLGGLIGYAIGMLFFASIGAWIIQTLHLSSAFDFVGRLFAENAFLTIAGAAFTPIPYKVFTIAGGLWGINLVLFVAASFIGRGSRFFLAATVLYFGGAPIAKFIDRWFSWITAGSFIVLVAIVALWSLIGR